MTAVEAEGRGDPDLHTETVAASDPDALHRHLKGALAARITQHRRAMMRQFAALVGGVAVANSVLVALLTSAGALLIVIVATAFVGLISTGALIGRMLMVHRDTLRRALMDPVRSAISSGAAPHQDDSAIDASRFVSLGLVPQHDDGFLDTLIGNTGDGRAFSIAQARLVRNPDAAKKTGRRIVFQGLLIVLARHGRCLNDLLQPDDILDALPGWDASTVKPRVESDAGCLFVALPLARDLFDVTALFGPAPRSLELATRLTDLAVLPRRLTDAERPGQ